MDLTDFVAVSGLPGVYKMVANRPNGLIVEDLDTGKRKFAPMRKHQFTPLASIGIFSTGPEDTLELKKVFQSMLEKVGDNPPVAHTADNQAIMDYFRLVMPDYDEDRVRLGDIKKVVKWFSFLHERDLLILEEEEREENEADKKEEGEKQEVVQKEEKESDDNGG